MIRYEDIHLAAEKYAQNEPKCPFYDESDIYEKVFRAFVAGVHYALNNQYTTQEEQI